MFSCLPNNQITVIFPLLSTLLRVKHLTEVQRPYTTIQTVTENMYNTKFRKPAYTQATLIQLIFKNKNKQLNERNQIDCRKSEYNFLDIASLDQSS